MTKPRDARHVSHHAIIFRLLAPHIFIAPAGCVIAGGVTGGLYCLLAGIGTPAQRQRQRIAALDADFG